ncbi:unnamed protein product [Lymnaea stagnalis]|uniref:Translation initiation factor eIF2B subunit delta n=1 Tax=Lymnaea stagnalis TaxID=6523 RepID=A0AAV2HZH3_LYMST
MAEGGKSTLNLSGSKKSGKKKHKKPGAPQSGDGTPKQATPNPKSSASSALAATTPTSRNIIEHEGDGIPSPVQTPVPSHAHSAEGALKAVIPSRDECASHAKIDEKQSHKQEGDTPAKSKGGKQQKNQEKKNNSPKSNLNEVETNKIGGSNPKDDTNKKSEKLTKDSHSLPAIIKEVVPQTHSVNTQNVPLSDSKQSDSINPSPKQVKEKKTDSGKKQVEGKQQAEKEKVADGAGGEQKSKAQLRSERRAIQEAQRAAKEAKKSETSTGSPAASTTTSAANKNIVVSASKISVPGGVASVNKEPKKMVTKKSIINETEEQMWARKEKEILGKSLKIDDRVLNLGFQYFHHNIVGANARCLALLKTLKEIITNYRTPEEKELSRDLEKSLLAPCITYLNYCRPMSTSMGNAVKYLKYHISKITKEDEAAIEELQELIDNFKEEKIEKAAEAIKQFASDAKISDDDVIMVYAASSLISKVLQHAHSSGKQFRVIVVEGRPRTEGKTMLRFLVRCGIPCSYVYLGSATHAMGEVTKVFLGAAAMFATGDMYSRSGNSMIAALARANNIPVLVCCETYKFTDKVQLHQGDSNLHARGKDLISIGHRPQILSNYEELGLRLLNIMYDLTASKYITCLITELGILKCTAVPAILRRQEDLLLEAGDK